MHRVHALKPYPRSQTPRPARRRAARVRDFRARGKLTIVVAAVERCALCEGAIDRFDREAFAVHGHCGACTGT